ncbi:MAG: hypothetical protein CMB99_13985 [Flavobacteriaceae bacterium]|nr:hypothetical protein [Flavobacteriaceae bacterium]|tara:strand:- start:85598 stop:86947 length:1350 start_codon:yes stop_codon:yes gene_type:complete
MFQNPLSIWIGIAFLFASTISNAQKTNTSEKLIGHWEGAFIKNNSYQKIEIEFSKRDQKIFSFQIMDEWHPSFGEFEVLVSIDSIGTIKFNTGLGKALLTLDGNNLELIGNLNGYNPAIYLHLKKVANPPRPSFILEELNVSTEAGSIYGHLHVPKIRSKTAVILVGGRGCYPDQTKYNLYAKFFRKYGISVLAYQKRGTGKSSGNCNQATIGDLSNDVIALKRYLENHSNGYEKIGVLGISAGGWTMTKASEKTNFDFMISIVGPSTSVREQQMQSMHYGADFYQLSSKAKENIEQYTNLMFDAKPNVKGYQSMADLLALAKKEKWNVLLEDTDVPKDANSMEKLWVRRHNFDPRKALASFENPFLVIYGSRDWIVPQKENVDRLKELFKGREKLLTTVVAYGAEHGMEKEAKMIAVNDRQSYWHFYRISSQVRIEIVKFLEKNKLID